MEKEIKEAKIVNQPENVLSKSPKKSISKTKIAAIAIGAGVAAAAIGIGIYVYTKGSTPTVTIDSTTELTTDDSGAKQITLAATGETEIKSGGTYIVTGTVTNGQLEVDTSDAVTIILNNVSITNPDGAPIKLKGTGKVTIELRGENTLKSTGTTDPSAAISSEADLEITGTGTVNIESAGKGIKAEGALVLKNGTYNLTTTDDALHSNNTLTVDGGTYNISSGDDGIHAETTLTINNGNITIAKSVEGLEGNTIVINGGEISVTSSDDGINAPNSDGTTMEGVAGDGSLTINGGNIYVNCGGDGLDSNGTLTITGGTTYVDGPTNSGNGSLDYDGKMEITGGTLIAVGSSGMAMNATSASQPSILMNLSSSYNGTLSFGGLEYTPKKAYQSILISSPNLKVGETYELKIGGNTVTSVTVSQNIVGSGTGMMGGGMMGGPGEQSGQMPANQSGNAPAQSGRGMMSR